MSKTRVLILDEKGLFKDSIESKDLKFSNIEWKIFSNIIDLEKKIGIDQEELLIVLKKNVTKDLRMLISKLRHVNKSLRVGLFADESFALDAWNLDLFHFDSFPPSLKKISRVLSKYNYKNMPLQNTIVFKTRDGLFTLKINDIFYIKANGNYSEFYIKGNKKIVQTKQLNKYLGITSTHFSFSRVHRSIIINFANIQKIEESSIFFYSSQIPLVVSKNLINKIKIEVLGYAR